MPAKDDIHDIVREALIKDGWKITHDPFFIRLGQLRTYADLAAERPLAAEKGERKIAIEIKSFVGRSPIYDLEHALGQYGLYKALLSEVEPERQVYLTISTPIYLSLFATATGTILIEHLKLALCVIDLSAKEVAQWIN